MPNGLQGAVDIGYVMQPLPDNVCPSDNQG